MPIRSLARLYRCRLPAIALIACLATPTAGAAEDASVYESPEVTFRLVATAPDIGGEIRAALLVDLAPGWKTYWLDPGDAGVPPSVDLSKSINLSAPDRVLSFPAPHRFGDAETSSNGYSSSMAIAITLRQSVPGAATELRASVLLGVCETICVPVQASLSAMPDAANEARVAAAFTALPRAATKTDAITEAALSGDGKRIFVSARTSASGEADEADLFLSGPRGWSFGKPDAIERRDGEIRFAVPVFSRPRKQGAQPVIVDGVTIVGGTAVETRAVPVAGATR